MSGSVGVDVSYASSSGDFASMLRHHRLLAGLTQENLAHRSGVSVRTISDIERGRVTRPHPQTVEHIARVVGLSPEDRQALARLARAAVAALDVAGGLPVSQLPPDLGDFTGRTGELSAALTAVGTGAAGRRRGPLTVVGMAGIGKTAFAVHLAHLVEHHFPDGRIFVDLRGLDDDRLPPGRALHRMLRVLGMSDDQIPSDLDEQMGMYRTRVAGRRCLILLDNAINEAQVRPLLPTGAGSLALVTSRNTMAGLDGARSIALDTMSAADAVGLLLGIIGAGHDTHAVREIAELCHGLPLAIRLAGARLAARPHWTAAALAERLRAAHRRLDELAAGDRAVRAAFDLSYHTLPAPERLLLRRLALLPTGRFGADAAAALLPPSTGRQDVLSALDRLIDGSLLQDMGTGRFQMHELLHLYAADLLASDRVGAREAVRRLHAWYTASVEAAAVRLAPAMAMPPRHRQHTVHPAPAAFIDPDKALAWLDGERANLLALIRHTAGQPRSATSCRLASALRGYFYHRHLHSDWLETADIALQAALRNGDAAAQATMHLSLGLAHSCAGRYTLAVESYQSARAATQACGWRRGELVATGNLGAMQFITGHIVDARESYTTALDYCRTTQYRAGEAMSLVKIGAIDVQLDRLHDAATAVTRAVGIFEDLGDTDGVAFALARLGYIRRVQGDLDGALEYAEHARAAAGGTGASLGPVEILRSIVFLGLGRTAEAAAAARRALSLARDSFDQQEQADASTVLAAIELGTGQTAAGIQRYRHALRTADELGLVHGQIDALLGLANAYRQSGDDTTVRMTIDRAVGLARDNRYRLRERLATTDVAPLPL